MDEMLKGQKGKGEINLHRNCFACGSNNGTGFGLKFYEGEDGTVSGNFFADTKFEGYSGIIHGGVVATLLDSVMTHCLLMKNIPALTGRLSIKYSVPIRTGTVVRLEARIMGESRKIFTLEGKAFVLGRKVASAMARYMRPNPQEPTLDSLSPFRVNCNPETDFHKKEVQNILIGTNKNR